MSTTLLDLDDRIVTDGGDVVFRYDTLVQRALSGLPFDNLITFPHPDVETYAYRSGKGVQFWVDDGEVEGPSDETFRWLIPETYASLDPLDLCTKAIRDKGLGDDYVDRLSTEWLIVEERQMVEFLRCLVYITDTMRNAGVVWGLGRGSSCASLVLFLLGVNKVDPVRYDIPLEEFYK